MRLFAVSTAATCLYTESCFFSHNVEIFHEIEVQVVHKPTV